nr:hypothetical protein [Tanacetum cinerariifolium]
MPSEDDVLPAKEQPVLVAISPIVDSLGYIPESDPKEDSEEDDEDPQEDLADYPTDREDDKEEEGFTYTEDPYAYAEAALQALPSLDYVPEYDVLPAKEQPVLVAISPIVDSLGYIPESDPKEDSEEDDEDPQEDLADYPTDREDDKEEEFSRDDAD